MSEAREIRRDGARAQKNSGRGQIQKGDAILEPFLVDYKEYVISYSVSVINWVKISTDVFKLGRRQLVLKLILGKEDKIRVWVIGESMFNEMREAWLKENEIQN